MTKKSGGGTSTTTEAPLLPLEPVEFPFYYEDYGEVAYNYDDQAYVDHDGGIPNVLPIINHRREQQQKSPFLPTPLLCLFLGYQTDQVVQVSLFRLE